MQPTRTYAWSSFVGWVSGRSLLTRNAADTRKCRGTKLRTHLSQRITPFARRQDAATFRPSSGLFMGLVRYATHGGLTREMRFGDG